MNTPSEQPRKYCVFGYWHREKGHPYVYKGSKVELHIYDDLDKAIDFIKEHSQWNVNITWCLTWDIYEIQKLKEIGLCNETNKKLYEDAFISNGEYGDLNNWKPDIDERLIEEHCEIDGKYVPATPLGYRDYLESRKEGIKAILAQEPVHMLTKEEAHEPEIKDALAKYDKIIIGEKPYVVTAIDEDRYFVVDDELHMYYLEYQK